MQKNLTRAVRRKQSYFFGLMNDLRYLYHLYSVKSRSEFKIDITDEELSLG